MLQFRIQSTPNPQARKYIVSQDLKTAGKVSYQDPVQCAHVPMAYALLNIPGVTQVHFFENCLTVTQSGKMNWSSLDKSIQDTVASHIGSHDKDFLDSIDTGKAEKAPLSGDLAVIDEILERTIRPSLQMDGGDIEPIDLDGNILTVRYLGACGGCPSSMSATLNAVIQILRDEFKDDLEVVAL